jgi:hypothetical protein
MRYNVVRLCLNLQADWTVCAFAIAITLAESTLWTRFRVGQKLPPPPGSKKAFPADFHPETWHPTVLPDFLTVTLFSGTFRGYRVRAYLRLRPLGLSWWKRYKT